MRSLLFFAGLILLAITQTAPASQVSEAAMRRVRAAYPGMTASCLAKLRTVGLEAILNHVDQCFKMMKPQRWRGLWLDAFEGQRFCPAPARSCRGDGQNGQTWISFKHDKSPIGEAPSGKLYVIDFVGRRTLLPGHYGHMGMSVHEVLVDRLISISPARP